jgi:hypothetical protein
VYSKDSSSNINDSNINDSSIDTSYISYMQQRQQHRRRAG